jgi:hypothetical protein
MSERRPEAPPPPAAPEPTDAAYTEEEEAEVQKRLEDLGYVE